MASASLQSLHHRLLHHHHHHHHTKAFPCTDTTLLFLTPTIKSKKLFSTLSSTAISSSLTPSTTTTTSPSSSSSLDLLATHLASKDFRQADEETRRLLIVLAGDAAQKRGYVFFSEVQFIDLADLQAIDRLWLEHSGGKFGYSVQKRLWQKVRKDFTRFFLKVGWMKKLDTEIEQYNYRAFPDEFIWELKDDTPEGHLPLTNALRGTQLLASILTHPAFETDEEVEVEEMGAAQEKPLAAKAKKAMTALKTDYSF